MVRVQIINETPKHELGPKDWVLHLQWCRYIYVNGKMEHGYRFIWRKPGGALQPARGQAIIYSLKDAEKLMETARSEGWGNYKGD